MYHVPNGRMHLVCFPSNLGSRLQLPLPFGERFICNDRLWPYGIFCSSGTFGHSSNSLLLDTIHIYGDLCGTVFNIALLDRFVNTNLYFHQNFWTPTRPLFGELNLIEKNLRLHVCWLHTMVHMVLYSNFLFVFSWLRYQRSLLLKNALVRCKLFLFTWHLLIFDQTMETWF